MPSIGASPPPSFPITPAPLAFTAPRGTVKARKVAPGLLEDSAGARLRLTKVRLGNLTVSKIPLGCVKVGIDERTGLAYAIKKYRLYDHSLQVKRGETPAQSAAYVATKLAKEAAAGVKTGSPLAISTLWVTDTHVYGQMALMSGDMLGAKNKRLWGPPVLRSAPTREEAVAMRAVLLDLERLHGLGLAHCDVKPANIMHRDDPETAQLGDFTFVRPLQQTDHPPGTPYHMAPEHQRAKMGLAPLPDWARADVWGVGLSFLEIIAGNPFVCPKEAREERFKAYAPWHAATQAALRNAAGCDVPAGPYTPLFANTLGQLTPPWRAFFGALLHPDVTQRPDAATARRMLDALFASEE